MKTITCCLCGIEVRDYDSHNPHPLGRNEGDRCCGGCNLSFVIPARINQMMTGNYNEKQNKDNR
jgi:hypothetical protein